MVAINPMRRGKSMPLLSQLTLNLNFFNPYLVEIQECDEIVNLKRLAKWREKDEQSN
jgi:hypothetical protein